MTGLRAKAAVALAGAVLGACPALSAPPPGPPVPAGWQLDATAGGDLTGDGVADVAIVVRRVDPSRIVRNEGIGPERIDANPRRLLVFARTARGYRQVAAADRLVPPAGSVDTPCLEDPVAEGGIAIARGVLALNLHHWLSCGSYGVASNTYKFRLEGGRFRLIGFDRTEFMRSSGEGEEASFNFLTGRKAVRPFRIDDDRPPAWRWSRFRPRPFHLDTLDLRACPLVEAGTTLC